jgi:hypothetical protein
MSKGIDPLEQGEDERRRDAMIKPTRRGRAGLGPRKN